MSSVTYGRYMTSVHDQQMNGAVMFRGDVALEKTGLMPCPAPNPRETTMKAVLYDGPRSYSVTDVPTPQAGPAEVRIKVDQVGVCGTDLHIHEGDFNAVFPLIPGHELVGVVDQLGDGVTRFRLGEQVTVNPNVSCGHCEYCLSGRLILCENLQGYGSNFPGFFAEYVTVPERLVFSVEGLPRDTAVFAEPAACAMHGARDAPDPAGVRVRWCSAPARPGSCSRS